MTDAYDIPAEELEAPVGVALEAGYDYFVSVLWQGESTQVQPVVWPMRLASRRQGNAWNGLVLTSYSSRGDH